jgi:hypothetical protein
MYCLLNDNELKRIKKVEEVTGTDAEIIGKFIPVDSLLSILDDLLCEYNHKIEELEDLQNDLNEHYTLKRVDEYEEYGVSQNDFI